MEESDSLWNETAEQASTIANQSVGDELANLMDDTPVVVSLKKLN